jgi:Ser/Thr protein kinase RdoA (MazF antagonist)
MISSMTADGSEREGLTTATAAVALRDVCRQLGLDPTGSRLLRLGENAIYALVDRNLVVRIARSADTRERVEREVAIARWLAHQSFPAVRLAQGLPQVVPADGRLVTFWELVTETEEPKSTADLGTILARFHALPRPSFPLPKFDPFSVVPPRLAKPGDARPADVTYLADLHRQLVESYAALEFPTPFGLIHGDAHRSNLLASESGVLLSDFEVVAFGPREWDLTPTAVSVERFGLPAQEYAQFVQAYGRDVTEWDGYRTLARIRDLTMTTWLMQNVAESPEIAEEFHARVTSMREGDYARQWNAF